MTKESCDNTIDFDCNKKNIDNNFFDMVYKVVQRIPRGKVANYGMIAAALGNKHMSRQVGWALHVNPEPIVVPCFRVVFADGKLSSAFAFGGINAQRRLLTEEGVEFDELGRVLPHYFCKDSDIVD